MVRQSIIILALLSEFVYEYRGDNTFVIQEIPLCMYLSLVLKLVNSAILGRLDKIKGQENVTGKKLGLKIKAAMPMTKYFKL